MTLKKNSAEGGVNTTAVTALNSGGASGDAFTAVAAGVTNGIIFTNAQRRAGSLAYRMTTATADAIACTFDMADTAAATFTSRFYFYLAAFPSATVQGPVGIRSAANASIGRLNMSATGQIQVVLGTANTTSTLTTTTLALNTWYRFEVYGTGMGTASASMTADVYVGENTGTPYMTTGLTGQNTTATVGTVRYGKIGAAGSNDWFYDDLAQNIGSATPLGPEVALGGDQTNIEPKSTVTLTAVGPGTWTQVSGPSVTITQTGTTGTFVAPLTISGTTLVFGYGGQTTSVTVLSATERLVIGGVEVAAWSRTTS